MPSSVFNYISSFFGRACASDSYPVDKTLTERPTPTDIDEFSPVRKAEADLAKKLQELGKFKEELFVIRRLVIREQEKSHTPEANLEPISPNVLPEIKFALTPHAHPTEKIIEDCIYQTQKDIQRDMLKMKRIAKTHAEHFQQCEAAMHITEKLYVMIHKIHHTLALSLHPDQSLPAQIKEGLEMVVSLLPDKFILLTGVIKIVNLANLLLKPNIVSDEKLFLEIEKGIAETIVFLNDDFIQLQITKEKLQEKYPAPAASVALESPAAPDSKLFSHGLRETSSRWQSDHARSTQKNEQDKVMASQNSQRRHSFGL